tara:strand:+ start:69 stop:422 length:354 start_codon:yes stop_codon:yes gene_type:complete
MIKKISILILTGLFLFSCSGDDEKKEKIVLNQGQIDLIHQMEREGMLNVEPQYNRAEISSSLWTNMTYSIKNDFSAGLALYCAEKKGTDLVWCEIFDMYSGKKLAKYSQSWGFKVFD